jgi:transposase, IS5 family
MTQLTLATVGFERYAKTTRRAVFLAEMAHVVPRSALCALIEPFCPKPGNGRPSVGVERMLRIYFLQQWLTYQTRQWRRRCTIRRRCRFLSASTWPQPVPDETTVRRFRRAREARFGPAAV